MANGKVIIDFDRGEVEVSSDGKSSVHDLASAAGFAAASRAWVRAGWDAKYVYSFTWMGRPIIQLPDDLLRLQEVMFRVRPRVVIETGVAHGGSLVFYASLLKAMSLDAIVVGVDVEVRPHNRLAIEAHELFPMIRLIEGSSTDPETIGKISSLVGDAAPVLVVLDSNHTQDHVRRELEMYSHFVSPDSFMIVADGVMQEVAGAPRSAADWATNNPISAIDDFLSTSSAFVVEMPMPLFNEGATESSPTYFPRGYLKRLR